MGFQISALDRAQFEHLFGLSDEELKSRKARRVVADKKPGFPCRVSLADAEIGEQVLLVHYEHQPAETPFRSSHAIYVRPSAKQAHLARNEVPEALRSRVLSLRGFDQEGMLQAADLAEGNALETAIEQIFTDPRVAYIHLHFAKPGCYAARVDRV
jgi:hypothetical protein